ncbi:MAG: hypothetical protein GY719_19835 [bacterium]|nr:hypothetical protein [bacterium]
MARRVRPTSISLFLILLGILASERIIEALLVPGDGIQSPRISTAIALVQAALVLAGIIVFLRRETIRTPLRSELALAAGSLLLGAIVAEAGARLWLEHLADSEQYRKYALYEDVAPEMFQYAPHQYLGYVPSPNYRRGTTSHNSLGFRNPELSAQKPAGVFRIAALGGSTTYTHKVEDNAETFTAQLERLLREQVSSLEVINAGVGGYTSWESLINLQFRVLDLQPDLVIVYHGTNDVKARLVEPAVYAADNSGRRKPWSTPPVHRAERSCLLRILLRRLGAARQVHLGDFVNRPLYLGEESGLEPLEILTANPPIYSRRNLESMIAIARSRGTEIVLMTWAHSPHFGDYCATEHFQHGFAEHNAMVREVAAEHGVPCFDFVREMPQAREYWADGRHVNERGALEKARLVAGFLRARGLVPSPEIQ